MATQYLFLSMLAHYVYASPAHHQQLEPRATTSPAPACTVNSDVVTNGNFYGYPNPPDYAPWALAPTIGKPGCKYLNGYAPCLNIDNGYGSGDPNCFVCEYGNDGGSDIISQAITFAPGCEYIVEATVACWGHNVPYLENNSSDYGTAHVFFRVVLDHTVVIPQQLSCPSCTSSSQPGCKWYPDPTYKVVRGRIVTPSSGKGELKVLISQAKQTSAVSPLLVTAVRMITPGTDQYT